MKWWLEKPMRMVQTNLREIDASLDVDAFMASLKEFSANVVLFNVGGIVANYPTELAYHYRNPYLKDDLVGRVLSRVKAAGIRFMARFDLSKLNEQYAFQHPDWLYKSVAGEFVNYNGQVQTCLNGYYQQEYGLKILEEVLDVYPIDGVFFNMPGYITTDYSGHYHGICQCDNCKQGFAAAYGLPLPVVEERGNPDFLKYEEFKRKTSKALFHRISRTVKAKNENVAICTYTHAGVDIFRNESNSGLDRPQPEWAYSASENVKTVYGSWPGMVSGNTAVHFIDFPYRHAAVSPALTKVRLAQNIANNGWLDYYVIGTLNNQDDRECFAGVKELFGFHQSNEAYYTGLKSVADVCLIMPARNQVFGSMTEFRGLFKIFSEAHILFDVMHDSVLDQPEAIERLKKYQIVIIPDMRIMPGPWIEAIDAYVALGGKILATGFSATYDSDGMFRQECKLACAGIRTINRLIERQRGAYFRIRERDKATLKQFENLDIIYLDGDCLDIVGGNTSTPYLGYIPPHMFGPPEKRYYREETDMPGLMVNAYQKGTGAVIPWQVGRHYYQFSTPGHSKLVVGVLEDILQIDKSLIVHTSPLVEVNTQIQQAGRWQLVNLVNHSGQLGAATLPPIPVRDIAVKMKCVRKPQKVHCLKSAQEVDFEFTDEGYVEFVVPILTLLETVVVQIS